LVVDDGRIIEQGDHETLLRKGGVYAELFHRQQLSEELERF
jgi:ABC-type multidrug transport system fused ATPase/permease subunit